MGRIELSLGILLQCPSQDTYGHGSWYTSRIGSASQSVCIPYGFRLIQWSRESPNVYNRSPQPRQELAYSKRTGKLPASVERKSVGSSLIRSRSAIKQRTSLLVPPLVPAAGAQ